MILICSDKHDIATYRVAKQLNQLGQKTLIITDEDEIQFYCIVGDLIEIKVCNHKIGFYNIKSYWFRRGNFKLPEYNIFSSSKEFSLDYSLEQSLTIDLLHHALLKTPSLSTIFNADLNRVVTLWKAKEIGFKTPSIGLFSKKTDLLAFKYRYKKIVIKPILNGVNFIKDGKLFVTYTSLFEESDMELLPDSFPTALFMEYINKRYEIRVFYLDGTCYCLATFSQEDNKTEIDFRKYNKEFPNRIASFTLPKIIRLKLHKLMESLRLKTGSIDFIVTPDNEFVFLEINPVGQFLNVEEWTNHNLSGKIAKYLIKISNKYE